MSYKAEVRGSNGWRDHKHAVFGISPNSPNWNGEKLAALLHWAEARFDSISLDVTDALYRHNFIRDGDLPAVAFRKAADMGTRWLHDNSGPLAACRKPLTIMRWAQWYLHPDYTETLQACRRAVSENPALMEAVLADANGFYRRAGVPPTPKALSHAIDYLVEEIAVLTLQARAHEAARIYPGTELNCLRLVREGKVPEAPNGMERQHFTRIKFRK